MDKGLFKLFMFFVFVWGNFLFMKSYDLGCVEIV